MPTPLTSLPREHVIPANMRVFISHGKNASVVEQIETMLGLANFESEVAVAEESTAIPVPDKVLAAMRRCQAGIIAVTVEEGRKDDQGNYVLNENVLIGCEAKPPATGLTRVVPTPSVPAVSHALDRGSRQ